MQRMSESELLRLFQAVEELTPEQEMAYDTLRAVCELKMYRDVLLNPDGSERITLDRLRELVDAERDGRVVVLPCKVGDTVWINFTPKHPANPEHKGKWFTQEVEIERVKIGVNGLSFQTYLKSFALSELGKTVFLTRAEAEQALVRAEAEAKGEQS